MTPPADWPWQVPTLAGSRWEHMEADTTWSEMPRIGVFCTGDPGLAHDLVLAGALHQSPQGAWVASTFYPTGDGKLIDLSKDPTRAEDPTFGETAILVLQPTGTGNPYHAKPDSYIPTTGGRYRGRARMRCDSCDLTVELRLERFRELLDDLVDRVPEISLQGLDSLRDYIPQNP